MWIYDITIYGHTCDVEIHEDFDSSSTEVRPDDINRIDVEGVDITGLVSNETMEQAALECTECLKRERKEAEENFALSQLLAKEEY